MRKNQDPMGQAIADYHARCRAARLRVFSPMFDEDEIPVATLFRRFDEMPAIEQEALKVADGAILDVGDGKTCYCHRYLSAGGGDDAAARRQGRARAGLLYP